MKRWTTGLALFAALGLLFSTGCSKKDGAGETGEKAAGQTAEGAEGAKAPAAAAAAKNAAFLELIPAETPY